VHQDSEGISLEQTLSVLRRRAPLILLCCVLVAAAAYAFSKQETKKYKAGASLSFSENSLSQQIAGLSISNNSSTFQAQQISDLELVRLGNTAAETAAILGHGLTREQVANSVSVETHAESNVVDISVTSTSPELAAVIANTYAGQFVKEQQRVNRQYFKSALAVVHKQLAALSREQRVGPDGLALQSRVQTLNLLEELGYGNVQVAQEAQAPSSPSSPKTSRNTAYGIFLGLVLGLGLAFALERLDRRIRTPEDLERIYRLPSLGGVPQSSALARSMRRSKGGTQSVLPAAEIEAFTLIRARLRFVNIDHDLRTVVIVSPAPGDGKTTIARHLAEAAARLGSRVLLLEVDLRHPTLAQQLDMRPSPGLAGVLMGTVPMDQAIESIGLRASASETADSHTLDILAAGTVLPPNPAELLESDAMDVVLERARSTYDLVVIDTPPLNSVSDALSLLVKVDGVVIVGWVGRSRRDAAEELQQVISSSGASLLGVIANGSKSRDTSAYAANPASGSSALSIAPANNSAPAQRLVTTRPRS
jgi:capsular exopolysaccharide synthesis family protein